MANMDNSDMPLWLYLVRIASVYLLWLPLGFGVVAAVMMGLRAFCSFMMKRYPGPPEQRPGYRSPES
jgi:hypothetical protein